MGKINKNENLSSDRTTRCHSNNSRYSIDTKCNTCDKKDGPAKMGFVQILNQMKSEQNATNHNESAHGMGLFGHLAGDLLEAMEDHFKTQISPADFDRILHHF